MSKHTFKLGTRGSVVIVVDSLRTTNDRIRTSAVRIPTKMRGPANRTWQLEELFVKH